MRVFRQRFGATSAGIGMLALVSACAFAASGPPTTPSCPARDAPAATADEASDSEGANLVLVGRIVTMAEPPVAEAVLVETGLVTCVGTRDQVLAAAGDDVRVVDIGPNVAYPGFIDAHAHWIGDRELSRLGSAKEAMDAAIRRGWTSISEQWVNQERLDELTALSADEALPPRVDAYLALNYDTEFFGDWYAEREAGPVSDRLRVNGLKIHLDDGAGEIINWEAADLTATIARADEAGWQVSVHSVSTEAQDLVLDAYEAALGATGPNPLHHRVDHAIEVSDEQLARMVAMDLVTVIHPDGGSANWVLWNNYMGQGADYPPEQIGWLARMRDFVDAGLHVAAATDAPWFFPDFALTDDIGRPVDQIAGGMDGRGREYTGTPEWMLDQVLTAQQGLRGVTLEAAYAIGDEARRGHLAPGMLGDVTILSGDVLDATPDEIRAMTVVATVVGGVVEYCGDAEVCGALAD